MFLLTNNSFWCKNQNWEWIVIHILFCVNITLIVTMDVSGCGLSSVAGATSQMLETSIKYEKNCNGVKQQLHIT